MLGRDTSYMYIYIELYRYTYKHSSYTTRVSISSSFFLLNYVLHCKRIIKESSVGQTYLWLEGNVGIEKRLETTA